MNSIRSKHHVHVPRRGSYYLVNKSIRSRKHAMSVTLNLGAVGIIRPASKPVQILYRKPLHSRVCSQSSLIVERVVFSNCFVLHLWATVLNTAFHSWVKSCTSLTWKWQRRESRYWHMIRYLCIDDHTKYSFNTWNAFLYRGWKS